MKTLARRLALAAALALLSGPALAQDMTRDRLHDGTAAKDQLRTRDQVRDQLKTGDQTRDRARVHK